MLAWLDRTIGWALRAPYIKASFALMIVVAFGLFARWPEVTAYTLYVYVEYGMAAFVLTILTILALHEFAHGLACKHFGGEVREVGVLMVYYVFPAFYCNVTDIYRIGRRRERLWVIFAGIYWQMLISAMGVDLLWQPLTHTCRLFAFSLFGGTFNINHQLQSSLNSRVLPFSQAVGVENLQAALLIMFARCTEGSPARLRRKSLQPSGPAWLLVLVCSIVYSAS